MDTAEHIHSSWLVSIGKVPYRDFFQHHNPLLWYLFAPVTQLFYRDTAIVYAARVAAILGWGAVLYKLYALVCAGFGGRAAGSAGDESGPRAVADAGFSGCRGDAADVGLEADAAAKRMTAQWALLFLLALSPLWKDVQNLCPDIFMLWGMLAGTERFLPISTGSGGGIWFCLICGGRRHFCFAESRVSRSRICRSESVAAAAGEGAFCRLCGGIGGGFGGIGGCGGIFLACGCPEAMV